MRLALFLIAAGMAFAQVQERSVTVTASSSITLQRDQVVFTVTATAPQTSGLDDVLAALQGSGISAANLTNVYSAPAFQLPQLLTAPPPATFQWTFTLAVPFAKMKDTIATLTALQQKLQLNIQVNGTEVSPQLQASQQCSNPSLFAAAQARAQMLASAAGSTLGPVLALSDGAGIPSPNVQLAFAAFSIPTLAVRLGDFSSIAAFAPTLGNASVPVNCTLVVKFTLLSN